MNKREKLQFLFVFFTDLASLALSFILAWMLFGVWMRRAADLFDRLAVYQFAVLLLVAYLVTFLLFDQKINIVGRHVQDECLISIRFNVILLAIHALLLLVTKVPMMASRYMLIGTPLFNLALLPIGHEILKKYLFHSKADGKFVTLTAILTTHDRAGTIIRDMDQNWSRKLHGLALLDAAPDEIGTRLEGVEIKATYDNFMEWLRREAVDEVYIDLPFDSGRSLVPYLKELESMGIAINLALPTLGRFAGDDSCDWHPSVADTLTHCAGSPVITLNSTHMTIADEILKRSLDIVGSLVGSVLALIAIALVAIPLKLESPGPLLFKQKRVGLNGRIFNIYKIRSMYADAEARKAELMAQNEMTGLMFKMENDPRITKVGRFIRKTSIDELPQFFNVLRGDMSLVGTRPPTLDEYEHYKSHHKRRLSMKPGITGLWQVSGRSEIEDFEEVVRLDVQYIDEWSFWLDIKLLLRTVAVVFSRRGAE